VYFRVYFRSYLIYGSGLPEVKGLGLVYIMLVQTLLDARTELLTCNSCFEGLDQTCRHGLDLIGRPVQGSILVIGPGCDGPAVQGSAQVSDGSYLLEDAVPWVRHAAQLFEVPFSTLVQNFQFVHLVQHSIQSQDRPVLPVWNQVKRACPDRWLRKLLPLLRPRLLIWTGREALDQLARWGGTVKGSKCQLNMKLDRLHGQSVMLDLDGHVWPGLITYALHDRARGFWARDRQARIKIRDGLSRHGV